MGSTGKIGTGSAFFGGGGGVVAATSQPQTPNTPAPTVTIPPVNADNPQVASQAPTNQNTPVTPSALSKVASMSDDELAALVRASKKAVMPNFLADVKDQTQSFVFQAGLNEKPQVLDATEFNQFMKDNNISDREIIARSVDSAGYQNQQGYWVNYSAQQILDMMRYSKLNYIGGKVRGQMYGAGAYFAMTGGGNTGYGGTTATAVLNPKTAKIISLSELQNKVQSFSASHPKFAREVGAFSSRKGGNASIYALAMGYNVITDHHRYRTGSYTNDGKTDSRGIGNGDYYNIIDRSALVFRK